MAGFDTIGRAERSRRYGVDCADAVSFRDWEPGGEYKKKLIVKNVLQKAQTLRFTSPQSTVFSLPFPQPIRLNSGLSTSIEITFRPLELAPTKDYIVFSTLQGEFRVPLLAHVPQRNAELPDAVDFGFCPVADGTAKPLVVTNSGQLPVQYKVSTAEPFSAFPTTGLLSPGQQANVMITFLPMQAIVMVGTVVIEVEGLAPRTVRVSGIGKFPHMSITRISGTTSAQMASSRAADATLIDFGDVPAGTEVTKSLILNNSSLVRSTFEIDADELSTGAFNLRPMRGVVPPEGEFEIKCTFTPPASGAFAADTFIARTPAGQAIRLRCSGRAQPPEVLLTPRSIDYKDIKIGDSSVRAATITNSSSKEIVYQFVAPAGAFSIELSSGKIAPGGSAIVSIRFTPQFSINYHKRVYCILKDQAPLRIDVIGTGWDDQRPMPFNMDFVTAQRPWQDDAYLEYWRDETADESPIQISDKVVQIDGVGSSHEVVLTNHTQTKVTACWIPPAPFVVQPDSADIAPNDRATFTVAFNAPRGGTYLGGTVEAFVFNKAQRSFRLVDNQTFEVPRCIGVSALVSTFGGALQFVPRATLEPQKISMPPTAPDTLSFATALLTNSDNTPLHFSTRLITGDATVFGIKPASGVIPPNSFQILTVGFSPGTPRVFNGTIQVILNGGSGEPMSITLKGDAIAPVLELENDGQVFFKPTAMGTTSSRVLVMRNTARVDAAFRWNVPTALASKLSITPPEGVLRGGDASTATFTFAPRFVGPLSVSVPLLVRALGAPYGSERKCNIAVIRGDGREGAVTMDPGDSLDFGPVLAGTAAGRPITVNNVADCNMCFVVVPSTPDPDGTSYDPDAFGDTDGGAEPLLEIQPDHGVVPARGSVTIQAILRMPRPGRARFSVSLYVEAGSADVAEMQSLRPPTAASLATIGSLSSAGDGRMSSMSKYGQRPLPETLASVITVSGRALRPSLVVSDVSSSRFTRSRAWNMVWADDLNRELSAPLSTVEMELAASKKFDSRRADLEKQLGCFPFNFSANLHGCPDTEMRLHFTNPSPLVSEWALSLAGDEDDSMERWAAPSEPTREEVDRATIVNDKIFSCVPSRGRLEPGESMFVTLKYRHILVGAHRLPALFKIRHGKQVMFALGGATLKQGEPFLYFNSNHHYLKPMPVGTERITSQHLVLYNDGAGPAQYTMDTSALSQMASDSRNVRVMHCAQPTGIVPANGKLAIEWDFAPLEVREYIAAIPIAVRGAATTLLAVHGTGYDPSDPDAITTDEVSVPPAQPILSNATSVKLATDILDFQIVPCHAESKNLIVMRNEASYQVMYSWKSEHRGIQIEPAEGIISGQGTQVCSITVCSHVPIVFAEEIACVIECIGSEEALNATADSESTKSDIAATRTLGAAKRTMLNTRTSHRSVVGVHTASSAAHWGTTQQPPSRLMTGVTATGHSSLGPSQSPSSAPSTRGSPVQSSMIRGSTQASSGSRPALSNVPSKFPSSTLNVNTGGSRFPSAAQQSQLSGPPLTAGTRASRDTALLHAQLSQLALEDSSNIPSRLYLHVRATVMDLPYDSARRYPMLSLPMVAPHRLPFRVSQGIRVAVSKILQDFVADACRDASLFVIENPRNQEPPLYVQIRQQPVHPLSRAAVRSDSTDSTEWREAEQATIARKKAEQSPHVAAFASSWFGSMIADVCTEVMAGEFDPRIKPSTMRRTSVVSP